MNIRPHDRFSCEVTLTPASVAQYARAAGDSNPEHFDAAFLPSIPAIGGLLRAAHKRRHFSWG
jgi:acyl dehydratase